MSRRRINAQIEHLLADQARRAGHAGGRLRSGERLTWRAVPRGED